MIRSPAVHLSALSFRLKLVDSCSGLSFLLDLNFFILILLWIKISFILWFDVRAMLTIECETKMSSSPHLKILPGLDLLRDDKHFLFSINSLGKNLILMFSYSCQLLQSKKGQNTSNSSPNCFVTKSIVKIVFNEIRNDRQGQL